MYNIIKNIRTTEVGGSISDIDGDFTVVSKSRYKKLSKDQRMLVDVFVTALKAASAKHQRSEIDKYILMDYMSSCKKRWKYDRDKYYTYRNIRIKDGVMIGLIMTNKRILPKPWRDWFLFVYNRRAGKDTDIKDYTFRRR